MLHVLKSQDTTFYFWYIPIALRADFLLSHQPPLTVRGYIAEGVTVSTNSWLATVLVHTKTFLNTMHTCIPVVYTIGWWSIWLPCRCCMHTAWEWPGDEARDSLPHNIPTWQCVHMHGKKRYSPALNSVHVPWSGDKGNFFAMNLICTLINIGRGYPPVHVFNTKRALANWGQPEATLMSEIGHWKLRALWCQLKGLDDVLAVVLLYKNQRHLAVERPFEQSIEHSLH